MDRRIYIRRPEKIYSDLVKISIHSVFSPFSSSIKQCAYSYIEIEPGNEKKGGNFVTRDFESAPLTFTLEEAVMFRKGEAIKELYNLALEPKITIHDLDQYVSLRGSLEMTGEYRKKEWDGEEEFSFSGQKYVIVSPLDEDDLYQFTFNFPVDITIPKSRVQNMDELDLVIDSFDYTLEDEDTLVISTEISVVGVYEEELDAEEEPAEEREEQPLGIPYQDMIVPFPDFDPDEDEVHQDETEERDEQEVQDVSIEVLPDESSVSLDALEHEADEQETVSFVLQEEAQVTNDNEQEDLVVSIVEKEDHPNLEYSREEVPEQKQDEEEVLEVATEDEQQEETISEPLRTEKQISYQSRDDEKEEEKREFLLTEFFSQKDEGRMATLRLYFVQSGDTLHEIAERYQIQISSILRVNDLEGDEDLEEGKLLYIPVVKTAVQEK